MLTAGAHHHCTIGEAGFRFVFYKKFCCKIGFFNSLHYLCVSLDNTDASNRLYKFIVKNSLFVRGIATT